MEIHKLFRTLSRLDRNWMENMMENVDKFFKAYPLGSYERMWCAESVRGGVKVRVFVYLDLPPNWRIRIDHDLPSAHHPCKLSPPTLRPS